jgi:hypothetical protein
MIKAIIILLAIVIGFGVYSITGKFPGIYIGLAMVTYACLFMGKKQK